MRERAARSVPLEGAQSLPPGTEVAIESNDGVRWQGWLLPRNQQLPGNHIRLKLSSGYNIGLVLRDGFRLWALDSPLWGEEEVRQNESGPVTPEEDQVDGSVALLWTGGTIASRVDYVTGGVTPVKGKAALEVLFPNMSAAGPVILREVFDVLSEDMGLEHWTLLAEEITALFNAGAKGIVVAHGTDTMAYTASALAFQLRDLPGPVVLVGAQRSIDRPSSDGRSNMNHAIRVARDADLGEVVVVMHSGLDDTQAVIHRGTRVRKMHSTRRDAFHTLNGEPLGFATDRITLDPSHRPRSGKDIRLEGGFDPSGSLLWVHPGLTEHTAEQHASNMRGIVLAGTGMGHVPSRLLPWIRRQIEGGTLVAMTTQCIGGVVDPYVYSRGRELLSAGVLYLGDMLPETALVKLLWALKRTSTSETTRRLMETDIAGEITERRPLEGKATQ